MLYSTASGSSADNTTFQKSDVLKSGIPILIWLARGGIACLLFAEYGRRFLTLFGCSKKVKKQPAAVQSGFDSYHQLSADDLGTSKSKSSTMAAATVEVNVWPSQGQPRL